ncbi:benzoate/H(+) symporter BenE family transporter [Bartonella sp. HY329]|uniref:benzoate/H(+) symporter BenE family transporter n=1 Tax=unclassified Bartonella TaxID=2645622 RepID=UPI0021CA5171|nr:MULTISPECIES: benzoate/H(+) symporter BenE family transporter [unclassified Bartonella]UXM94875.1 benzoate/H(+) symporter BenE family transporter [Bartonella sp. HY329]UXN09198.1 benzoate/H(+) symporter BenE family transporter [Bartonella sp. HY328]
MRLSHISAGFIAAIVGFGGTLAILIHAATIVGATPSQIVSWVSALCLAIALSSFFLSWRYRMPIITAWSTPGLALIGATSGYDMAQATGAFICCALAITLTAFIKPLSLALNHIPAGISSGMLAGVLLSFIIKAMALMGSDTAFVLPLIILFFTVRRFQPSFAVLIVLIAGLIYASISGNINTIPPLQLSSLDFSIPSFQWNALIGLALPLYLVTMASQNLPGFAVLRASGFEPPIKSCLSVTGIFSLISAFLCASSTNLAAISAAICTGWDAGKDPKTRWYSGIAYAGFYLIFAIFSASLVAVFASLPAALIVLISGLALLGAFSGALTQALIIDRQRIAAIITFAITASNISIFSIGAPFWALMAGLIIYIIGEPKH